MKTLHEPLDLSVSKLCEAFVVNKAKLPILEVNTICNVDHFDEKKDIKFSLKDNKGINYHGSRTSKPTKSSCEKRAEEVFLDYLLYKLF